MCELLSDPKFFALIIHCRKYCECLIARPKFCQNMVYDSMLYVCVCVYVSTGYLLLGVYGITDQDHTQSWFPPGMLKIYLVIYLTFITMT